MPRSCTRWKTAQRSPPERSFLVLCCSLFKCFASYSMFTTPKFPNHPCAISFSRVLQCLYAVSVVSMAPTSNNVGMISTLRRYLGISGSEFAHHKAFESIPAGLWWAVQVLCRSLHEQLELSSCPSMSSNDPWHCWAPSGTTRTLVFREKYEDSRCFSSVEWSVSDACVFCRSRR